MQKELIELAEKLTWKPIEEAPKDGAYILARDKHDYVHKTRCRGPKWHWEWEDAHHINNWFPTHFIPLPEANYADTLRKAAEYINELEELNK